MKIANATHAMGVSIIAVAIAGLVTRFLPHALGAGLAVTLIFFVSFPAYALCLLWALSTDE